SVRVAYRAEGRLVRRVARSVFWPQPNVDSVLVSLVRRPPPVDVDETKLWALVDEAFAQRRKTMRNALVRLGLSPGRAEALLAECGIEAKARPEELGLEQFAAVADALAAARSDPSQGVGA